MNFPSPFVRSDVIGCIEQNRQPIIGSALTRALPVERQTILADALANRTLDYLVAAMADADENAFISWISDSLKGLVREQSLFSLFASVISASLDIIVRDLGSASRMSYAWLEGLQRRVDLTVSAARLEFHEDRFNLNSVDAKIDEVLYRLSERDTLTAEHSRSVGLWCSRIAKRLGMSHGETLLATRSGLIHDIGKILTPLEILTAPRGLDENEWKIMRAHTLQGVATIRHIRELDDFVPAVRWHHERIDGRGYPDGLDGTQIPVTARIVAVADAFNAMIARRPYREPLAPSVALEELKRHSGAHFDPSIITAMIEVIQQ